MPCTKTPLNNWTKAGWYQCGFRHGRRTTEQNSTLHQVFEKAWEHAKDVYTCFVDLGKAYDRVPREKLSGVFREHGVDGRMLLAVKSLYSCSEVWIRIDGVNHNRSPWVLDPTSQGLQTMALGPNLARKVISSGTQRHFVSNGKWIFTNICWLSKIYHIPRQSHYVRCPPPELLCISSCGPLLKILETYDLATQSQPSLRGCHRWNCRTYHLLFANDLVLLATYQQGLQNALGRFSAAYIQEGTNVSQGAQSSVFCKWAAICSSQQVRFKFPRTVWWYSRVRKLEQRDWYTDSESKRISSWALLLRGENGIFQWSQSC